MYTVKIGLSAAEHDQLVVASPLVNLLQSASWAKIKEGWQHERIGFYDKEQLRASVSILIKPLPLGFTMLYIPRGIALDYADKAFVKFVISELKKIWQIKACPLYQI